MTKTVTVTGEFLRTLATDREFLDAIRNSAGQSRRDNTERYFFVYKELDTDGYTISNMREGTSNTEYGTRNIGKEEVRRALSIDAEQYGSIVPVYFVHSHYGSVSPSPDDLQLFNEFPFPIVNGTAGYVKGGYHLFQCRQTSPLTKSQVSEAFRKMQEKLSEEASKVRGKNNKRLLREAKYILNDPKWGRIEAARLRESGHYIAYLFPLTTRGFSEQDLQRMEEFAFSMELT